MTRYFFNLPALPDVSAVEAAADRLNAKRVAGYRGYDGIRACVEIDQTVAEMLDRAAVQVEVRTGMLAAIAETIKVA